MLVGIDAISGYRQLGSVTWALVPGDWYLEPGSWSLVPRLLVPASSARNPGFHFN